ncbi:MAG: aminotransferase class V-fold PLP-dependent enzyme [Oscillospiraceae bacterium]|nr:aminotransferase class V-fold PLP-dependent enzyme [Oscillospiraceae bacterium]
MGFMIYFDNAASAMPLKKTLEAFNKIAKEHFSNPAALHKGGIEAEKVITAARGTILKELPKNGSFIFTSGATESNNMAIINSVKQRGKTKTVTTTIEHPSVDNVIGTGDNTVRVFPSQIIEAVDDSTALVSVTSVCGETGFIVDTKQIFAEIKKRFPACIIHVDGVQGFLKNVPLDADLISVSAHKIGGLTGVGGLFVGDGIRLNPMLRGGGQQKGLRPGTEPTALIAAFGAAVDATVAEKPDIKPLCDRLISGLNILNLKINGRISECVPDIVNFSCGVKSEIMLHFLAEHNIYVSSGSACSKGKKSKILPAYGIPDKDIDTAIRISFGRQNTLDEVDTFLNVLEKGVKRWK